MQVIVTRPRREALRWVLDLAALGVQAVALPMIDVGPVTNPAGIGRAWQHLEDYVGVMFVSGNAVDYFFESESALPTAFFEQGSVKTRAWATGPGTSRALLRQGVAPQRLDAPTCDAGQFDSEALWHVVGKQVHPGDRVLIVRGADSLGSSGATPKVGPGTGRDWFAGQVAQAGGLAEFVVAYQRGAPELTADGRELALRAADDGSIWLFSSTEAVSNLTACLPGQNWTGARAVATHPRIASAVHKAGFGVVQQSRPTLPELVATLKRMEQRAI